MAQLQRPPFVFMNGRLTSWEEAQVHVGSEALIRGISVFEGIKGYWSHDGQCLQLLSLREHFDRLARSCLLQYLPFEWTYETFTDACFSLVRRLATPERDLWLRPTVLAVEGHWGADTVTDLAITCYHQEKQRPEPISVGISTWQRPSDAALPARIKSAANYQAGRLARIEGRQQGFDDMVLLNAHGRVAEATGSCVLIVRDGRVATPPHHEGCLESITVNLVEAICRSRSIPFERRPVDRTELLVADEICLAGTLMELGPVKQLGARKMPTNAPVFQAIAEDFWDHARGRRPHPAFALSPV